ncbi:hypothetical protein [Hyalangium rubrum]|uniref:Uncharacterized protein n=1 Tax=Hyalangium rubrum TaxID=3103134 RepID=A0ABU5H8A7_9BACT|nr:hypothetical protein [Hyalangium sp. s54d21]MDY7229526.1 hypothetical protein [Hyalangium sp. s54d21]
MHERGEVPLFRLPVPSGPPRGTLDAWQRRDMLIALTHPGCDICQALHRALQAKAAEWRKEEIDTFTVVPKLRSGESLPPGALEDAEGRVSQELARAFGGPSGGARLAVANRFARLYAVVDIHSGPTEAVLREALEWMELAQLQCGECFAPLAWD